MKALFIFDDGKNSTFYLYDLMNGVNRLIHFAPEIPLQTITLGELYTREPIEKFIAHFAGAFSIEVKKYLVMEKAEGLALVENSGLASDGKFHVTNPTSFTACKNQKRYEEGDLALAPEEIDAYISWQIDDDGSFGVFTRQEDVIRLMRRKLVTPRLSMVTKHAGKVSNYTKTNLNLKDLLKMGSGYLSKGDAPMKKQTVPTLGTYELSQEQPYRLVRIEWAENPVQLRAPLR